MDAALPRSKTRPQGLTVPAAAPLIVLPLIAFALFGRLPGWQWMWLFSFAIFCGLKWLTCTTACHLQRPRLGKILLYLLLWSGMNPEAFFASSTVAEPAKREWLSAIFKLGLGIVLLFSVPVIRETQSLAAGWVGMIGLILVLHFGLFHLSSLCFRNAGIDAEPIMNAPLLAASLGDFWGRRWNLAFRDLAYSYVFRPVVGRIGVAGATMLVFLISGLIHDLVISVPARAGYAGPTAYFMLQGAGLLVERSALGKRLGLANGLSGRLFCALFTIGPVGLLFHEPFVCRIIMPTLIAIGV